MPVNVGTAYVDIRPDLKPFGRELRTGMRRDVARAGDESARSLKTSFAGAARNAAAAFGAAFAAVKIKNFIGDAIGAASDLSESLSKAEVVFGSYAGRVETFASTAATAIGQSKQQALEATATFGNLFTAMGIGTDTAAGMSVELVTLASDLASFNNTDPTETLLALRSGLVGEQEPLRRFGVNLNEATLKAKAFELGLVRTTKETLGPAVKAQAAYALILEQTGTAQGDFARTSGGLANQQRIMTAQWADAKSELGEGLLPVMVGLAKVINDELIPAIKTLLLSPDADVTGWAATLRDAIGDTVGFILGALATLYRGVANAIGAIPGNVGEGTIENLRGVSDAFDDMRLSLHASTAELLGWASGNRNAELTAKLLAPSVTGVADAMEESTTALKDNADAAQDAAAAQRGLLAAQRDVRAAERDLADVRRERDLAAANVARFGSDTAREELADAEDAVADAEDRVADAKDRVADANDRVNDLGDKTVAGTPRFVGAVDSRTSAVKALNDQLGITEDKLGVLNDVGNILGQATGLVLPTADPLGPTGISQPGLVSDEEWARRTRGWGDPPVLGGTLAGPATPTSKTVNVYVTEPQPDPGLLGKAIAWQL